MAIDRKRIFFFLKSFNIAATTAAASFRRVQCIFVFICTIYVCTNINQHFNFLLRCRLILRCEETTTVNACTLCHFSIPTTNTISPSRFCCTLIILLLLYYVFHNDCRLEKNALHGDHYLNHTTGCRYRYILRRGGLINTRTL